MVIEKLAICWKLCVFNDSECKLLVRVKMFACRQSAGNKSYLDPQRLYANHPVKWMMI